MEMFIACVIIFAIAATWIRKQQNDINRLKEENEIKDQIINEMTTEEHLIKISSVQVEQGKTLTILVDKVGEIGRGLYGDPANKTMGLIDRQEIDEKRIDELVKASSESKLKKMGLFATGGALLVEAWHHIKSAFL